MRRAARTEGPDGKPRPDTEVVFDPATYVRGVPFDEALARTSSLTYAGPPSYLRSNFQRGVKRLPVAWTA